MRYLLAGSTSTAAADALLWHIGNKYGRALAGRTKELGKTADESMAILALAAQKSGWGRIILENRLQLDETIKVFFENCAFCEGLHGENSPSCYFWREFYRELLSDCSVKNFRPVKRNAEQSEAIHAFFPLQSLSDSA